MQWSKQSLPRDTTRTHQIRFRGGLNTETPPLELPAGFVIDSNNFEVGVNGGYRRIPGYERFDGMDSPSAQTPFTLPATVTGSWSVGDTITGVTSTETATVVGETADGFVIANASGTFTNTEDLQISAASVGTCTGSQYSGVTGTQLERANLTNLTADVYRALISAVPGSGSVLGVHIYNGVIYAFRNNAGGTAAVMHKSSASGWTAISLGVELKFNSGGTNEITVGATVAGASSGESGVVTAVAVRAGTWAGGDAEGSIMFASTTGTLTSGEGLEISAVNVGTATANSAAVSLSPNGRYQFINDNFGGAAGTYTMYGCDGVNRAFSFDGTTYVPITTGMTTDTPKYVAEHKKHLFLSFSSSLQHSSIGDPYGWSVITGASELTTGDNITGLKSESGSTTAGAMVVCTRNKTFVLYGNSSSDWVFNEIESEAGCLDYTLGKIGRTYMLDDRGIRQFAATQDFGNFRQATVSNLVHSYIQDRKSGVVDSHIVRNTNQYRLFFGGGAAVYMTVDNNKISGIMPVTLAHTLTCSCSGELSGGDEGIFFGDNNGFVYQMEKGTSFDGATIDFKFQLAYDHIGSPNIKKRYRKVSLEVKGTSYISFEMGYTIGYGDSDIEQPVNQTTTTSLSGFNWDDFTWDNFTWDGRSLIPTNLKLVGSAENISLAVSGTSEISDPFTVTGATIHYSQRRRERS